MRKLKKTTLEVNEDAIGYKKIFDDQVVVQVREPDAKKEDVGHVSLETKNIYVSIYPESNMTDLKVLSVLPSRFSCRGEKFSPSKIFYFHSFKPEKIKFMEEFFCYIKSSVKYSFLCAEFDRKKIPKEVKDFENFKNFPVNCSSLVCFLLLMCGIDEFVDVDLIKENNFEKNKIYLEPFLKNNSNYSGRNDDSNSSLLKSLISYLMTYEYVGSRADEKIKSLFTPLDIMNFLETSVRKEMVEKKCIGPLADRTCMSALLIHEWSDRYQVQLGCFFPGYDSGFSEVSFRKEKSEKKLVKYERLYVISHIESDSAVKILNNFDEILHSDFNAFVYDILDKNGKYNFHFLSKNKIEEFSFKEFYEKNKIFFQKKKDLFFEFIEKINACENPEFFLKTVLLLQKISDSMKNIKKDERFLRAVSIIEKKSIFFIETWRSICRGDGKAHIFNSEENSKAYKILKSLEGAFDAYCDSKKSTSLCFFLEKVEYLNSKNTSYYRHDVSGNNAYLKNLSDIFLLKIRELSGISNLKKEFVQKSSLAFRVFSAVIIIYSLNYFLDSTLILSIVFITPKIFLKSSEFFVNFFQKNLIIIYEFLKTIFSCLFFLSFFCFCFLAFLFFVINLSKKDPGALMFGMAVSSIAGFVFNITMNFSLVGCFIDLIQTTPIFFMSFVVFCVYLKTQENYPRRDIIFSQNIERNIEFFLSKTTNKYEQIKKGVMNSFLRLEWYFLSKFLFLFEKIYLEKTNTFSTEKDFLKKKSECIRKENLGIVEEYFHYEPNDRHPTLMNFSSFYSFFKDCSELGQKDESVHQTVLSQT